MGKLIIYGDQNLVKGYKLNPLAAIKELYSMPKYKPMDLMANNKSVMGYHLGRFQGHEWKVQRSINNLIKLVNDNDYFTRWDSGQFLMREIIKNRLCNKVNFSLQERFIYAIKKSVYIFYTYCFSISIYMRNIIFNIIK